MSFQTFEHTLAYPLFGAKFLKNDTFVVSGGGGEGRHGIPNEIDIFQIVNKNKEEEPFKEEGDESVHIENQKADKLPELLKKKELKLISNYIFEKNSTDAPMSMDIYNNKIFVGCNDAKDLISKNSRNESLKVLKFTKNLKSIELDHTEDLFKSTDPQTYIKKIQCYPGKENDKTEPALICLNSDDKSKISIEDYSTRKQSLIEESAEIKDFTFVKTEGSFKIFYITKKQFKYYNIDMKSEIKLPQTLSSSAGNHQLLKIINLTSNELLIIGAYPDRKKIFTFIYNIAKKCVRNYNSSLLKGIKSINCAAFKIFSTSKNNGLLALGTSDLSIVLLNISLVNFRIDKLFEFKKSHTFALTNVIISPSMEYVVSISAANSIHVIELPKDANDLINLKNSNNYLYILLLLIILLIAYLLNDK